MHVEVKGLGLGALLEACVSGKGNGKTVFLWYLFSAVKSSFVAELELTSTRDALKRGDKAISRGDSM